MGGFSARVISVSMALFSMDGLRAASLGSDAKVRIWDVTLGSRLGEYSVNVEKEVARAMTMGRDNNNLLCYGDLNGNVVICDIREVTFHLTLSCFYVI
ncbi:unnamed protein product [Trichobilharzia regenti]|nr:unnamed protein product [Trichobilharzia regenti]